MANWDSADLLARCKRYAKRPATDESFADADWYALLAEAQVHWVGQIAAHYPGLMYGVPTKLVSTDAGYTYAFASGVSPIGQIEIRVSRTGPLLVPGSEFDPDADFTYEDGLIRMTNKVARTFSDGPYARYVTLPGSLDGSTAPVLTPAALRILLVWNACARWASVGGYMDPAYFEAQEQKAAWGDPRSPADVGLMGALALQFHGEGGQSSFRWWAPS